MMIVAIIIIIVGSELIIKLGNLPMVMMMMKMAWSSGIGDSCFS